MAEIKLNGLCKVYPNGVRAVRDFTLEIADGEFVVLVGPSGCGKSTLLRMIAGLEEITSGELFIGDRHSNALPPKERDVSMVFQNYALYPHMTAYQNMALGLEMRHVDKAEIREKIRAAAEMLDITDLLERKPRQMSGGQQQRVALGRAIVREPSAVLLDEPLSNLDAKLRNQMRFEIIKLHRRLRTTFVYVTHDQTEAMTMADRIVVMSDGMIMQAEKPQSLYDCPQNTFVAGFLGTPPMNFLSCELAQEGDGFFVTVGGCQLGIPPARFDRAALAAQQGKRTLLGVRAEDILLTDGALSGKTEYCERVGSDRYFHLLFDSVSLTAKGKNEGAPPQDGDEVRFGFDLTRVHLFDEESGRALPLR